MSGLGKLPIYWWCTHPKPGASIGGGQWNGLHVLPFYQESAPFGSDSHPEAKRSLVGFQAQMNTSDSWPRSTVALLVGISTPPSTSIASWLLAATQETALISVIVIISSWHHFHQQQKQKNPNEGKIHKTSLSCHPKRHKVFWGGHGPFLRNIHGLWSSRSLRSKARLRCV